MVAVTKCGGSEESTKSRSGPSPRSATRAAVGGLMSRRRLAGSNGVKRRTCAATRQSITVGRPRRRRRDGRRVTVVRGTDAGRRTTNGRRSRVIVIIITARIREYRSRPSRPFSKSRSVISVVVSRLLLTGAGLRWVLLMLQH